LPGSREIFHQLGKTLAVRLPVPAADRADGPWPAFREQNLILAVRPTTMTIFVDSSWRPTLNENNYRLGFWHFGQAQKGERGMDRRVFLKLGAWSVGSFAGLPLLEACTGGGSEKVSATNLYKQTNLAASNESYNALFTYPDMIDAWGAAIRPAGAGGHFWVTASAKSYEFIGDVTVDGVLEPLTVDPALGQVALPPLDGTNTGAANGVVFNGIGTGFRITQTLENGETFTAPAKFVFVADNGVMSAWAQRSNPDGTLSYPMYANTIVDEGAQNTAFFGLAINTANTQLVACDFGNNPFPRLRVFNDSFVEEDLAGRFANPFLADQSVFKPGDYAPWAAHTHTINGVASLFVCYVNTSEDPDNPGQVLFATENTGRGTSRLVEFTEAGEFVAIWDDRGTLNGPWGVAVAPDNFGALSNQLIVSNFSDGTLVAFDTTTKRATELVRDDQGNVAVIQGIWAILFGNGVKLGDSNALYFAAGPNDETEGLFGSLRFAG
jgi:uncharacterized protein (TIGR03118 family)